MRNFIILVFLGFSLNSFSSELPCGGEEGQIFINLNGEQGGFVSATATVEPTAYLGKHVQICGNAMVLDEAQVTGNAIIADNAKVYDRAKVFGNAKVYENAEIYNTAVVWENAEVFGNAKVYGFAGLKGNVKVYGIARMYDATYDRGFYF